jgi:hypothetical protein
VTFRPATLYAYACEPHWQVMNGSFLTERAGGSPRPPSQYCLQGLGDVDDPASPRHVPLRKRTGQLDAPPSRELTACVLPQSKLRPKRPVLRSRLIQRGARRSGSAGVLSVDNPKRSAFLAERADDASPRELAQLRERLALLMSTTGASSCLV